VKRRRGMTQELAKITDEFREDAYVSRDHGACIVCSYEPAAPLLVVEWQRHLMAHEISRLRSQLEHLFEGKKE